MASATRVKVSHLIATGIQDIDKLHRLGIANTIPKNVFAAICLEDIPDPSISKTFLLYQYGFAAKTHFLQIYRWAENQK